MVGARMGYT
uniref:Uncharacterized protein n=1 Tax=Rhizophora mucronata TaxID=61149 RepID=A0A2P2NB74_RHIMU